MKHKSKPDFNKKQPSENADFWMYVMFFIFVVIMALAVFWLIEGLVDFITKILHYV